ncbi:MAG: spore maturation protein [Ruminococcaceae bacterium]|nr:spore maturation protein [Oscillospiraceae bacterium]
MTLFLPILLFGFGVLFLWAPGRCTKAFLRGAGDGLAACANLFPTLLLFVCAVSLFRASGAVALLTEWLSGICGVLRIPAELLPLMLTRPISGSASTAVLSDLLRTCGPDSTVGMMASVLCGASETVLYVLSVYAAGIPVTGTRHLIPAALLTCFFVTVLSVTVAQMMGGALC